MNEEEAADEAGMASNVHREVVAIGAICTALATLDDAEAGLRVLKYAADRYGVPLVEKPKPAMRNA